MVLRCDRCALCCENVTLPVHHGWFYRRFILPLLALLRMGTSPETLAWSIAAGLMIGINPVLGTTTLLCLAVAFIFGLNIGASQFANHAAYPLEIVLLIPFIRLGSRLFHTEPMPLSSRALLHAARTSPVTLTRQLWIWEWHALLVWAAFAIAGTPLIAFILTPLLRSLRSRIAGRQYPILTAIDSSSSPDD